MIQVFWGCDPGRQFESGWLRFLLADIPREEHWLEDVAVQQWPSRRLGQPCVLVESGLLRLSRPVDPVRLEQQRLNRAARLAVLSKGGPFLLIHLSDEEGLDGDELYPMLPPQAAIWRNFPHSRFLALEQEMQTFPIGPRLDFLAVPELKQAQSRQYPWAFMGTIWGSGSRRLATSLFMRALPQGFFHGGTQFGVGLPLGHYQAVLADSVFALCPEGDRHLDTFRLYESLQMGCIPLVVDVRSEALPLLGDDFPLPCFQSWPEALAFAQFHLSEFHQLNLLQEKVSRWWKQRCRALSAAMRQSLESLG